VAYISIGDYRGISLERSKKTIKDGDPVDIRIEYLRNMTEKCYRYNVLAYLLRTQANVDIKLTFSLHRMELH
jgi:hypothetical protein